MNYIIIGALLAIGWYMVELIYYIIDEIIMCRLHKARWYNILAGKEKRKKAKQDVLIKKIGFM